MSDIIKFESHVKNILKVVPNRVDFKLCIEVLNIVKMIIVYFIKLKY